MRNAGCPAYIQLGNFMTDLIYVVVIFGFFVAVEWYALGCGKL